MSEKSFKQAKSSLAFSQSLVDQMRQPQMAPMAAEGGMPQEAPQSPEMAPQEEMMPEAMPQEQEEKSVVESVVEAIKPMFDDIKEMFSKKEDEPKEAVLKVEGTLEPGEKKDE